MKSKMKWLIFGLLGLTSCELIEPQQFVEIELDTRLPKDVNGYSYFVLTSKETQNIHRISGSIRINGRIPDEPRVKVEWENNLYWNLTKGDTIATITKTYLNRYTGRFTVVTLPPLVSSINALVATINPVCYNSADGSINTVIAPMWEMRGDTMTVVAKYGDVMKVTKIVLK